MPSVLGAQATDSEKSCSILTIDRYVTQRSTVHSMAGQTAQLYLGERAHRPMFAASLAWLESGAVNGVGNGTVRMGY